ncbi:hypothetical protein KO504_14275 [Winogradskyella psychrotolerans]|uniref:hypothetical protein n=1 Tax=Winogradskyella psychrotolerans TaxID=1344585 RepID=UPI001C07E7AF|nr:hypothetical protein [Winogradskyella psychrotolerans]MBU2922511.1 hypothetical protein [Winogradskyella psychrotolerans]
MRLLKITTLLFLTALVLTSCFGDKKVADVSQMNDTGFVNKNFKGNRINYSEDMSACESILASDIATIYSVSESDVIINDITKTKRRQPNSPPSCMFYIKMGDNDFEWLRGSISVQREIRKDEMAYDVAKAVGNGEEWEEAWALNKSISKSSEWIKDMGMAAVWNLKKVELKIKFKGYTLNIYPIKNKLNQVEVAKNRDYKKVAIAMAKASGFIK